MLALPGHTTGRETLASSGSHCSAASLQKRPVSEQRWLSPRDASDPVRCLPPMTSQGLEFPMRPSRQNTVDVAQGRVESGLVVPAVVIDPTPDVAVEHPGEVIQSFVAGRRTEHDAEGTPPASRQPRPECIAEEVELLVGVISAPVIILAVDDFRLLRMKCQSAFGEPPLKRCAQCLCLSSTAAVADRIIGITLERDVRMVPPHPPVERVMKKEVGQEWTHDPSLRRSSFPADEAAIRHLNGRSQPSVEVKQHPWAVRMFAHRPHQ